MTPVLASISSWDIAFWLAFIAGGVCLEYFVGIARRIKPRN